MANTISDKDAYLRNDAEESTKKRELATASSFTPQNTPPLAPSVVATKSPSTPLVSAKTAISSLLAWRPAPQNLFEVQFYDDFLKKFNRYYCSSVNFPGVQLVYNRAITTKLFTLENYQYADEVTITWRETYNHEVRKFHEDWIKLFYDKEKDAYISAKSPTDIAKRFKTATVFIHATSKTSIYNVLKLTLINMLPMKTPELDVDWSKTNFMEYSITYKIEDWNWEWVS